MASSQGAPRSPDNIKIDGNYARMKVIPEDASETDAAWVFLKREKGGSRALTIWTYTTDGYNEFQIPAGIQL